MSPILKEITYTMSVRLRIMVDCAVYYLERWSLTATSNWSEIPGGGKTKQNKTKNWKKRLLTFRGALMLRFKSGMRHGVRTVASIGSRTSLRFCSRLNNADEIKSGAGLATRRSSAFVLNAEEENQERSSCSCDVSFSFYYYTQTLEIFSSDIFAP